MSSSVYLLVSRYGSRQLAAVARTNNNSPTPLDALLWQSLGSCIGNVYGFKTMGWLVFGLFPPCSVHHLTTKQLNTQKRHARIDWRGEGLRPGRPPLPSSSLSCPSSTPHSPEQAASKAQILRLLIWRIGYKIKWEFVSRVSKSGRNIKAQPTHRSHIVRHFNKNLPRDLIFETTGGHKDTDYVLSSTHRGITRYEQNNKHFAPVR